jgi:ferredoxin/flavodoxin
MDLGKVHAIYFSPTGTTERAVKAVAEGTGITSENVDLTTLKSRQNTSHAFQKNDLVVVGMPVYAGRLPMNLESFFSCIKGDDTPAIALVMFGNREYEDALIELKIRLEGRGFKVIAGAAFVGEHTFSKNIAMGRPNTVDLDIAREFGGKVIKGIDKALQGKLTVKGNYPYVKPGFDPAQPGGPLTTFGKIGTTEDCTRCGLCVENCPWGAINAEDMTTEYKKCLRCFRCIRICPVAARKVSDQQFYEFVPEFEKRLNAIRKEPELFLAE